MCSFALVRHSLAFTALAILALGGSTLASAQNAFYTTGTYTIDAAHSVNGDAFVGADSKGHTTDSMGNPYNPTVHLVTGGSVANTLEARNSSTVTVEGGSIGTGLIADDNSTVTISGGSMGYALVADHNSTVTVSGGSMGDALWTFDTTKVTVSGGTFSQYLGLNFIDRSPGSLTLLGNNLMATNARPYPIFANIIAYDLSGTLQSGTNLSGYVLGVEPGLRFTLNTTTITAVPEPGSLALLAGIGISGAGFLARRRKQACQAA